MKKLVVTILLAIISVVSFSQQRLDFSGNGEMNQTSGYFTKYATGDKYADIDGSPYYNDDWLEGTINLKNNVILKIDKFRYDVYEEKLIFLKDETPLYFANPEDIKSFTVGEAKFIKLSNNIKDDYYEVLFEGEKLKLLKDYDCNFAEGKETDGINPATRDRYKISSDYFLKLGDNEPIKFKLSEKAVVNTAGEKKESVKNYIKENKLNCKEEEDLIEIFKFFASTL